MSFILALTRFIFVYHDEKMFRIRFNFWRKYNINIKKKKKHIQTLYLCGLECVFCFFMKNPIFRVSSSLDNIHSYERIFLLFFYTVYVLFLLSLFVFYLVDFLYTILIKNTFLFLRICVIIILTELLKKQI